MKNKTEIVLGIFTFLGIFLHFYNLNWGYPFYFHPDERNIIYSVLQLSLPRQMDPHFFAYGTVPIYSIYFVSGVLNKIFNNTSQFVIAILAGRFFSAFFATLLIPFMYFLGVKLKDKTTGIIAAFLTITSIGFIQFSHFLTFEMWLTFFTLILFYLCLKLLKNRHFYLIFLIGVVLGLLVGIKITSLALLPLPIIAIGINYASSHKKINTQVFLNILRESILIILLAFIIFCITNPFTIIDYSSFVSSINYESSVATGTLPVFYTGGFYNTIPVIFQLVKVLPFLITWPVELAFIILLPLFLNLTFKLKNSPLFILLLFFVITFFSQSILFVKWTRYVVPSIPYIYLILSLSITMFLGKLKSKKLISLFYTFGILTMCVFTFSFFITVYVNTDTRISASRWAITNIKPDSRILSEIYDLGIVPFNQYFPNITLFNFYDLDNTSSQNKISLDNLLTQTDYIILPSQRIYRNRIFNKSNFPNGNVFYSKLFSGNLGFVKIYQTPCDIFCKITYLNDPVFSYEETASVFDRPTVYIFKKVN